MQWLEGKENEEQAEDEDNVLTVHADEVITLSVVCISSSDTETVWEIEEES